MFSILYLVLFCIQIFVFRVTSIEISSFENEVIPSSDEIFDENYFHNPMMTAEPNEIFKSKDPEFPETKGSFMNFQKFLDYNLKPTKFLANKKLPVLSKKDYKGPKIIWKPITELGPIFDENKYFSGLLNNVIYDPLMNLENPLNITHLKMHQTKQNLPCSKDQKQNPLLKCDFENPLSMYNLISEAPVTFNNIKPLTPYQFSPNNLENYTPFRRPVFYLNNNIYSNRMQDVSDFNSFLKFNKKMDDKSYLLESILQAKKNVNKERKFLKNYYLPLTNKNLYSTNVFNRLSDIQSKENEKFSLLSLLMNKKHSKDNRNINQNSFFNKKEPQPRTIDRHDPIYRSKFSPFYQERNNTVTKLVSILKTTVNKTQNKDQNSNYLITENILNQNNGNGVKNESLFYNFLQNFSANIFKTTLEYENSVRNIAN